MTSNGTEMALFKSMAPGYYPDPSVLNFVVPFENVSMSTFTLDPVAIGDTQKFTNALQAAQITG
jgi:hypothetical protein